MRAYLPLGGVWLILLMAGSLAQAAPQVTLDKVYPDKLVYGFAAPGNLAVTVTNATADPQTGHLKVILASRLDHEEAIYDQPLALAGKEKQVVNVPFTTGTPAQGAEYGYEARAVLSVAGQPEATAREFFMVTDNPVKIGHLEIPTGMCDDRDAYSFSTAQTGAQRMRDSYFCMAETAFWAPCDFSELTTTREYWTSGQAGRYNSQKGMKAEAQAVHAIGGRILIYADKWACGPVGFENARKHPEWYHWGQDWYGCKFDVSVLDWIEQPTFQDGKWKPHQDGGIWAVCPLLGKPEVAQFGVDQIAGSMKQFGWDGVRFDNAGWYLDDVKDILGHPAIKPGTDLPKLEGQLIQQIKAGGRAAKPGFIYGDNVGWVTDIKDANPKWLAEAAGGGLMMNEGMNEITQHGSKLNDWGLLRDYLKQALPAVRQAGGYPYGIVGIAQDRVWATDIKPVHPDPVIAYAVLMASGMHLCYHVTRDYWGYMRLFARYCAQLYADDLQFVTDPSKLLTVTSPREVWWKEYVRRRDLPDGTTQIIVHLINPSTGQVYDEKNAAPDPQDNITVHLTPPVGMTMTKALAITADGSDGPVAIPLPLTHAGEGWTVTVPPLQYWTMLVFEGRR